MNTYNFASFQKNRKIVMLNFIYSKVVYFYSKIIFKKYYQKNPYFNKSIFNKQFLSVSLIFSFDHNHFQRSSNQTSVF